MAKSIIFRDSNSTNSIDLQNSDFRTKDIIYRNFPNRTIDLEPYPRRDGFRFVNSFYPLRDIVVSGTLTKDTEANLKISLDDMKEKLSADEGELDIDDGGTTIRYDCTVASVEIPEEHYHITRVPYSITFRCQPFGKETSATTETASITNSSAAPFITTINPTGSIAPNPILKWSVVGTPSAAITKIVYTNSSSGDIISIENLVLDADGDYLQIDTDLMKVTTSTNGGSSDTEVDFTGVLPLFISTNNTNSVSITGGGGAFTIEQRVSYFPTYL